MSKENKSKNIEPEKRDTRKINSKVYFKELAKLQIKLVKLQEWIKHENLKVVVYLKEGMLQEKGG